MFRILFVCMGNICRSPAAEEIFRETVRRERLEDRIECDSCGTIDYHTGEPPDPRMREAAGRRGYRLRSEARQFQHADFDRFDLILAMDEENLADLKRLVRSQADAKKLKLICDYHPEADVRNVPDPYYGGHAGFERVLDILEQASDRLLEDIRNEETIRSQSLPNS